MERIKEYIKNPQVWGFLVSVAVIALVAVAFFYPDNIEGHSLRQPDMQQGAANGQEAAAYEAATGEKALWTDALFGGMPTFQISPSYPSNSLFTWLNTVYGLGLPAPSNLLFMMMFGFLILLYALRQRWYLALLGALAWGFSSYFVIIIGAGHIWKFLALTYVPPTIAGFILVYRHRPYVGSALLSLFAMLQLNANHPQMTYYFGLVMAIIAICFLIDALRKADRRKELLNWLAGTGLALLSGALAVGANLPSLYNTYEYSKETKRAQSELTPLTAADESTAPDRPTGGLPKGEIVGWSYGRGELFSLVVPNIKGGASARPEGGNMEHMTLDKLDGAGKYTDAPLLQYLTQYFNDSEGTNGPVYVGAIIFALFILGCIVVKGPLKWAMLASTVVSCALALGYNWEWLSDLMIYNFPLYNKFRAVESILVVAEFAMPLMAVLGLGAVMDRLLDEKADRKPLLRATAWSFGVPAAFCALVALAPGIMGDTVTDTDRQTAAMVQQQVAQYFSSQGASQSEINSALSYYAVNSPANAAAIDELRKGLVRSDAWRSLFLLVVGGCCVALLIGGRARRGVVATALILMVGFDGYTVDKRYVSHSSFGAEAQTGNITFEPDGIDQAILTDGAGQHYRVLDIPGFNSPDRSYFHHMVGGYHAAKLNRYEDLIQRRLMPMLRVGYFREAPELDDPEYAEMAATLRAGYEVADMLNAQYIITGDRQAPVLKNTHAYGPAWLVDSIAWVDGADAEMAALDPARTELRHQAVADRAFADALPARCPSIAAGDTIRLVEYTPNRLTYSAVTAHGGVGVFSEVWFPWGWKATVNGEPAPLARVNYILRAIQLPAGKSEIVMTFNPDSLAISGRIAYACVTLIYMIVLAGLVRAARRNKLLMI